MNPTGTAPIAPTAPANSVQSIIANYKASNPSAVAPSAQPNDWYSQMKANMQTTAPAQTTTPSTPSAGLPGSHAFATPTTPVVSNPMTDINQAGADVASKIQGTGANAGQGAIERGVGAASSAAMAIPNAVADVIPGGKAVLGAVGDAFGKATSAAGNIGNTMADISQKLGLMSPTQRAQYDKQASDFANSTAGQTTTHIADTLNSLGNIANTILAAKGGADVAQNTVNAIPGAVESVKQGATAIKNTVSDAMTPTSKTPEDIAAAKTKMVQSVASDWQKPAEVNKPAFNNARAILAKDPTIPQFLAEQKLDPNAHVIDGKYDTADSAEALRDTAGKMSHDTLRPSLQMADYSTPKMPVEDIKAQAIKNATADKSLTPGNRATVINNIEKESSALSKENPDGMSLTNAHDSKITYAKDGGYSPVKSAADNNLATANRHMASALQKGVEDNAPVGVPVKAFNDYLSKYYKGADYLDSLQTKTAPASPAQLIARGVSRFGGAALGAHFGGGVVSEFAGYQMGKALEHAVENLSNPMRQTFLRNLEITNPKAFGQVQDYLKAQNTGENGLLRLPPATSETPIPLGPDTVTPPASVAPYAAKNPLPSANPKTGRMMRVYNSAPK